MNAQDAGNRALIAAVQMENTNVVRELITAVDPSFPDNQALRSAIRGREHEITALLLSDPRVARNWSTSRL